MSDVKEKKEIERKLQAAVDSAKAAVGVPGDLVAVPLVDLEVTSLRGEFWRRLRRNKLAMAGLLILSIIVLSAIFADIIATQPYGQVTIFEEVRQPPSAKHWMGTDLQGRDLYSRIVHGARFSLIVGFSVVAISLAIGVTIGGLAGYFGGVVDAVLSRLMDIWLAFPFLVGAIILIVALGGGRTALIAAIAVFGWVTIARLFRGSVIAIRNAEYVEAARALGAGDARILVRHILPNAITPTLVYAFALTGTTIISEAALSFLGYGVQEPIASWGLMIAYGSQQLLANQLHLIFFPSLALTLTVLGFILLGDGLRDSLDPRLR
ncbi:MAG: ABC transporter permease [Candidatus Methylomirabilaceae bacterium]